MTHKQFIVLLPEELHAEFREFAFKNDASMSEIVRKLIMKYLALQAKKGNK